ncbi:MAG: DUF4399 domain-containing protein [Nevskiales bacterium]|nr:DUF4399 domain-containing protein [Nevskiales bacterium]
MKNIVSMLLASLVLVSFTGTAQMAPDPGAAPLATPAPKEARVYFIEPRDGAKLRSPFKVVFGLSGMGIAPAGVVQNNTGHHHLLIDGPDVDLSRPLPATDRIRHFGGGQTETTLALPPGKHTLQLLLGDAKHQPHRPPILSDIITITVK